MASINGISIKNLVKFRDHEGMIIYQGDVAYNNKVLGFWSQDFSGGMDIFHFDENELKKETSSYIKARVPESHKRYADLGYLLSDLVGLMAEEKEYRKNARKGFNILVAGRHGGYYSHLPKGTKEDVLKGPNYAKLQKEEKEYFGEDIFINIFTSVYDFDIVT